jgi:hypothetical protein
MRLISAGSLVRAQSGPVFARVVSRERRLSRRSLGEGDLFRLADLNAASYDSASQPYFGSAIVDWGLPGATQNWN